MHLKQDSMSVLLFSMGLDADFCMVDLLFLGYLFE